MKLTRIEWKQYSLTFKSRFANSQGILHRRHGLILRGESSDGYVGYGEVAPLEGFSRETLSDTATSLTRLSAKLANTTLPATLPELQEMISHLRHAEVLPPSLHFGLETLLADLASQAHHTSISHWLNKSAASAIPLNTVLADKKDHVQKRLIEKLQQGFKTIKVKVGLEPAMVELEKIARIREISGDAVHIRLDANQAYTYEQALLFFNSAKNYNIEYIEEPLRLEEIQHLRELRENVGIPVALDESLTQILGADGAEEMIKPLVDGVSRQSLDVAIIKPTLLGGYTTSLQFADVLHKHGIKTVITSCLESPIGVTAAAHLAAAIGEFNLPCGLDTVDLFKESFTTSPPAITDGNLLLPDSPGLGISVLKFHNSALLS